MPQPPVDDRLVEPTAGGDHPRVGLRVANDLEAALLGRTREPCGPPEVEDELDDRWREASSSMSASSSVMDGGTACSASGGQTKRLAPEPCCVLPRQDSRTPGGDDAARARK